MDGFRSLAVDHNSALVAFAFLQADCRNTEYRAAIVSLEEKWKPMEQDVNCNGNWGDPLIDGDLQTDGYQASPPCLLPMDIVPMVHVQWPGNHEVAGNIQHVAQELREIADQIERRIVDQATLSLKKNIISSPPEDWKRLLSREVQRAVMQGVGLENLPQERVLTALTLTLVNSVCEQAPRLLRNLFSAAVQFIVSTWSPTE